jgi:glycogen synthase
MPTSIWSSSQRVRRVLMTADAVGGVWQYSVDLATALSDRGIETTLVILGPRMTEAQSDELVRRNLRFVEAPFKLEWADSPWEDLARAGEWLLSLESVLRPDIVHLNGFCHASLPWKSVPIVVAHSCVRSWWRAVHGVAAPAEWDRYGDAVASGLRAARLVIAPSCAMLSALHEEYGSFGAARVISNGRECVDHMAGESPIKTNMVFSAGRLWDQAKNVAALRDVSHELPWRVFVAGETDPGSGAQSGPNITFLGPLTNAAIARWHARAAIYALPARYEPFGLSVLEAAVAGSALVLGDIPSLRENWADAALFVHPGDRHGLASAIQALIDDPAGRKRLAARAMASARRFTVARMANAYVDAYHSVLVHAASAA